jgi:hypothetical protein
LHGKCCVALRYWCRHKGIANTGIDIPHISIAEHRNLLEGTATAVPVWSSEMRENIQLTFRSDMMEYIKHRSIDSSP